MARISWSRYIVEVEVLWGVAVKWDVVIRCADGDGVLRA
jgi:hypothetical protein